MKAAPPIHTFIPSLSRGRPRLYRNVTGYYPYGIAFADWRREERYRYGGKEQDRTCGLELHDFHARQYDAQTCRFTSMDQLAEQYAANSPYVYCLSDLVAYTDPSGMAIKAQTGNESGRFGLYYDRNKSTEDCFTSEACAGDFIASVLLSTRG
jgi:RHS repeat-associated protein